LKAAAPEFIRSAAGPRDFPADGAPEIALVGRSNVGKSSLINALVGRIVARTSARPGKTRLVNIYRVRPPGVPPFYVMDLPGFGYARGGAAAAREFEELAAAYFNRQQAAGRPQTGSSGQLAAGSRQRSSGPAEREMGPGAGGRIDSTQPAVDSGPGRPEARARNPQPGPRHPRGPIAGVVFAIDSRHPGLPSDVAAGQWLRTLGVPIVVAATKVDKLSQADRARLREQLEQTFGNTVLPVSATTGEGLEQLWKLLLRWISNPRT
jgi:GTP-binding protein EngB required for normal cell division